MSTHSADNDNTKYRPKRIGRPRALDRDGPAHRRLLTLASKAYYVEGRSKTQIAMEMDISRFKVSRYLDEARQLGIVSVTINSDLPLPELSLDLAKHLSLPTVRVVETYGDEQNLRAVVGRAAGTFLQEGLDGGEVLGIGWGRTLNSMLDNLEHLPLVEIVQLSGKFGGDVHNSAAALTRRTNRLAGGGVRVIPAPFFIDDARQAAAARRHPDVASVVARFEDVTTAVVGIGAVSPAPISVAYNTVPERFADRIIKSGAIGEVQGSLYAADGHVVDGSLGRHTLSITPLQLARVDRVIAAVAGVRKTDAVHAVCNSGIVTDLVLDVSLATALLAMPPILDVHYRERTVMDQP